MGSGGRWWCCVGATLLVGEVTFAETSLNTEVGDSLAGTIAVATDSDTNENDSYGAFQERIETRFWTASEGTLYRFVADFQLGLDLNVGADSPSGEEETEAATDSVSTNSTSWRNAVKPAIALSLSYQPLEILSTSIENELRIHRYFGNGADVPEWSVDPSADVNAFQQAPVVVANVLPQDTWTNDFTAGAFLSPGLRFTPDATIRHVVTHPLACVPQITDPYTNTLYSYSNFRSSFVNVRATARSERSDVNAVKAAINLFRQYSQPLADCPYVENDYFGAVYSEASLSGGAEIHSDTWDFNGIGGAALITRQLRDEQGTIGAVENSEARPQVRISLGRIFPWGELSARVGAEVEQRLGYPDPTYDLSSRLAAELTQWETLQIIANVGMVQAYSLEDKTQENTVDCRVRTGQLEAQLHAEWQPRDWITNQAGMLLTDIRAFNNKNCLESGNSPTSDGASVSNLDTSRVWVSSFFVTSTLRFGRDLVEDIAK